MSDRRCEELFEAMVESVGVKTFAANLEISARQVYRMLNGVQPNPVQRFCQTLQACDPGQATSAVDHVCQQQGGYFVSPPPNLEQANVNAVKESAEAIVAISEGRLPRVTIREIREAISALAALERRLACPAEPAQACRPSQR